MRTVTVLSLALALVTALALLLVAAGRDSFTHTASAQGGGVAEGEVTLTLLHNHDAHSTLLPLVNAGERDGVRIEFPVAGVAAFKTVVDREIADARTSGNAVLNVYAGNPYLPGVSFTCSHRDGAPLFDAVAQGAIPYDAHVIGSDDFDATPDFFERFVRAFEGRPFISANLDFSGEAGFDDLVDGDGLIDEAVADGRPIGRSMIVADALTGERFGLVGAITPELALVSFSRDLRTTPDLEATAAAVQAEIDRLRERGIDRIIVVTVQRNFTLDLEFIRSLRGVDIAVSAAGDTLLQNPAVDAALQALPGDSYHEVQGEYPLEVRDADGRTVYVVAAVGRYEAVGRLDVVFGADGEVARVVTATSHPRPVLPASDGAAALGLAGAVPKDPGLVAAVEEPLEECLAALETTVVATTEVAIDLSRATVRARESNAGNLVTDAFIHLYDGNAAALGLPPRSADHPVIAVQNGGGIRQSAGDLLPVGGVLPGPIFHVNTLDALPFPNPVTIIPGVSPADLKEAFENSILRHPDTFGAFLQVGGLTVVYDPSRPVGARVVSLTLETGAEIVVGGEVVANAPAVTVLTNSFIADGGDGYAMFARYTDRIQLSVGYEQAFREYLQSLGTIPAADPRYAPGGEGRIVILEASAPEPDESAPAPADAGTGLRPPAGPSWPAVVLGALALALVATALRRLHRRGV